MSDRPDELGEPDPEPRVSRTVGLTASPVAVLIGCLTVGAALRILTAVVSGTVELADTSLPFRGPPRTYDVLTTYGSAGDGLGALLVVALAALLTARAAEGVSQRWLAAARVVVWLTGISTLVYLAGVIVGATAVLGLPGRSAVEGVGLASAYLVLIGGAGVALARHDVGATAAADGADDDDSPVVFAIDRISGEAFAWQSLGRAQLGAPRYGVEDGELEFYLDDGRRVHAEVRDERVVLTPGDANALDTLVTALQAFAQRKRLKVDPDGAGDPLAYAGPVMRWQWLELWPNWLRGIGRLVQGPRP